MDVFKQKKKKKIENMVHCSVWDKYSHTFEQSAAFYGLKEVNYLVQSQTYLVDLITNASLSSS